MTDFLEYQTLEGEPFDMIALKFYGDEFLSGKIRDANPEFAGEISLARGTPLKIPILEITADESLPPWKRG